MRNKIILYVYYYKHQINVGGLILPKKIHRCQKQFALRLKGRIKGSTKILTYTPEEELRLNEEKKNKKKQ